MSVIQEFDLNMIPDSAPVVIHCDQYDHGTGRLVAHLYKGSVPYTSNGTVVIQGRKPDGRGFDYNATISGGTVTADLTEQMTAVEGNVAAQFVVTDTQGRMGSFAFTIAVQKSALPADTDMSESEYQIIEELLETAEELVVDVEDAVELAETAATTAETSAISASQSATSASTSATQASTSASQASTSATNASNSATTAETAATNASTSATNASNSATAAATSESNASTSATNASMFATQASTNGLKSEGFAVGEQNGTPVGPGSPYYQNNAAYYAAQAGQYATGGLIFKGSVAFANIPTSGMVNGDMYNITDDFTTDSRFIEGAGVSVKAGADIAYVAGSVNKWDILALGGGGGGGADALNDLTDVSISSPTNGQGLVYDSNAHTWKNGAVSSSISGLSDVDLWYLNNGDALLYDSEAQKWENHPVATNLRGLSDTLISSPQDNDSLMYDAASGFWVNKPVQFKIIDKPTVSGRTMTYNGQAQGPTITWPHGDMSDYVVIENGTATDAGTYYIRISLKNTNTYVWDDFSTASLVYSYTINKATGAVTLTPSSVTLISANPTANVVVSGATGNVTLTSNDTDVATVSPASMVAPGGTASITGVDSGTTTIAVNIAESANYLSTNATINVTADITQIFGVEWDGTSSSAMTRTDMAASFTDPVPAVNNGNGSSPFDNILPWSGMERVNDANAGTLVKIPKFWYKLTTTSAGTFKLQISPEEQDGFNVSPAHQDRGDGVGERDYVYVGAYHCATSTYKSTTGVNPAANDTRANFRTYIHNLGSDIWQWDKAMLTTIQMLYLVEYADWDSQKKIGAGCSDAGAVQAAGLCDAMVYHTGTNAADRATYGHVRYRYIEDLWANVRDWLDGLRLDNASVYSIMNPANFSNTTGGTFTGFDQAVSGNIKKMEQSNVSGLDWFYWPTEIISDSTYSTYVCDYGSVGASSVVVSVGGGYNQNPAYGLFYQISYSASYRNAAIGSRLQKLPAA